MKTIDPLESIEIHAGNRELRAGPQSLNSTDLCPKCNKVMRLMTVGERLINPIRAKVCLSDRIALPVLDPAEDSHV